MDKSMKIYNYIIENCKGYANRIKGRQLMKLFDINDHKTLRSYIEKIRQDDEYKYLIGSEAGSKGGYWLVVDEEERQLAISHLYLRAEEQLNTCDLMKGKSIYEIAKI